MFAAVGKTAAGKTVVLVEYTPVEGVAAAPAVVVAAGVVVGLQ